MMPKEYITVSDTSEKSNLHKILGSDVKESVWRIWKGRFSAVIYMSVSPQNVCYWGWIPVTCTVGSIIPNWLAELDFIKWFPPSIDIEKSNRPLSETIGLSHSTSELIMWTLAGILWLPKAQIMSPKPWIRPSPWTKTYCPPPFKAKFGVNL